MLKLQSNHLVFKSTKVYSRSCVNKFSTSAFNLNGSKDLDSTSEQAKRSNLINSVDSFENFQKHLKDEKEPIIVDFFATWCGPCKLLTPKLQEAVVDYNKFKLYKVDIDKVPKLAQLYQITSVPTVLAIKNGHEIHKFIGFQNTPGLVKFLDEVSTRSKL